MLRMRSEQMEELAIARQAVFREEAGKTLRRVWPEECEEIGEEGLEELVATGVENGIRLGMVDPGDLLRFLELHILLGPD